MDTFPEERDSFSSILTMATPKGYTTLLTPENCTVIFIDHQPQMAFGVQSIDRQSLINNTVALAKSCKIFNVPIIFTSVETKSFSGNIWPQLLDVSELPCL